MRIVGLVVALAVASLFSGCGATVSKVNQRPAHYYQKTVKLRGQIVEMQNLTGETLLEIADERGSRILVQVKGPTEHATGDWVKVRGLLVPEARVGDRVLYDVVVADDIGPSRAPRFRNVF